MTKVISFFERMDEDVLRNHQHYCRLMGYTHEWVESAFLSHEKLRTAYKYNVLLDHLKSSQDNELVLMLDAHGLIMHPLALEQLMVGMDSLIISGPTEVNKPEIVYNNMVIVRNTEAIRQTLFEMLMALHGRLAGQDEQGAEEELLLKKFNVMASNTIFGDVHLNLSWRITTWAQSKIFVVFLGSPASFDDNGHITRNALHQLIHDANLERLLVKQINGHFIEGKPLLETPNYPAISEDAVSHFNPHSKIALVTLYTHHINTYARVSEHNVKRYCDRHGYAYHVYRGIPQEIDQHTKGNWIKPWLLKQHIASHDWVIWVDADVLFRNQSLQIEPILLERELLFAKDLCAWPVNSGVMGFKNTEKNIQLLDNLWQRILKVQDKTTVYSDQGDQHHIIKEMYESGLVNETNILNCLTINTPPQLSTPKTLLTHYIGWGEPYRSIYMAADDKESALGVSQ